MSVQMVIELRDEKVPRRSYRLLTRIKSVCGSVSNEQNVVWTSSKLATEWTRPVFCVRRLLRI